MTILTRIFGTNKAGTVDPSRVERVAASQTGEDFARPVRAQVYREATVTFESGYTLKGIVIDYTEAGLRIRFPTNEAVPRFLTVNARSVGIGGRAEVVWHKGSEIGLKLI